MNKQDRIRPSFGRNRFRTNRTGSDDSLTAWNDYEVLILFTYKTIIFVAILFFKIKQFSFRAQFFGFFGVKVGSGSGRLEMMNPVKKVLNPPHTAKKHKSNMQNSRLL